LIVETFSAKRLVWGSNYPTSEGTMLANLDKAKAGLASLSEEDREWIFGKTAQTLYPKLADYL
jgi:L-fuconolactonase